MTRIQAIEKVRAVLLRRYPAYDQLGANERMALAAGVLADDFSVREMGDNRGGWVDLMLEGVELGPGYRWCGAAVRFLLDVAKVETPGLSRRQTAGVSEIMNWAKRTGRWSTKPIRGGGAIAKRPGISHVGISLGAIPLLPLVRSAEGNTSASKRGSQDNGDGFYRRTRSRSFWTGYVDWEKK